RAAAHRRRIRLDGSAPSSPVLRATRPGSRQRRGRAAARAATAPLRGAGGSSSGALAPGTGSRCGCALRTRSQMAPGPCCSAGTPCRRVQLPGLGLVPGVRVAAVGSGSLDRARGVAAEFGIARAFGSGEALAESPDVDLVIVSSTPDAHARHAIAALKAGKHVLCEKPM